LICCCTVSVKAERFSKKKPPKDDVAIFGVTIRMENCESHPTKDKYVKDWFNGAGITDAWASGLFELK
jgi:hypothetical protein